MSKSKMKRLSFSYPDSLKDELENKAKKDFRTLPSLIKMILNEHLEKRRKK